MSTPIGRIIMDKILIISKYFSSHRFLTLLLRVILSVTLSNYALAYEAQLAEEDTQNTNIDVRLADHVYGNPEADYSVITYFDFNCVFCRKMRPSLKRLVNQSNSTINWVFRYYPSQQNTESAEYKSQAAECSAHLFGEKVFWSFTEKILIQPLKSAISFKEIVSRAARASNVSVEQLETCIHSKQMLEKVRSNKKEALALKFTGTPSMLLVNHQSHQFIKKQGVLNYPQLKAAILSLK